MMLMPAFGGGLTLCSHLVRWGERVTPLGTSERATRAVRRAPRSNWSMTSASANTHTTPRSPA